MESEADKGGEPHEDSEEFLVSIIVVPRENFSHALRCLSTLIDNTDLPYRLIYVEGGAPRRIRAALRDRVRGQGGIYISSSHYLRPTRARNLGLAEAHTRYALFIDNDVLVTPGWLPRLVECAEQHQAAYVSPVILLHGTSPPAVHVAGGVNRIEQRGGQRRFIEAYHHMYGGTIDDLTSVGGAVETTMAEFHAVLVRRTILQELGGLYEGCSTAFEHNDLCLSIAGIGGKGWLEPRAVVDYLHQSRTTFTDCNYMMLRWSKSWIGESLEAFCRKWGLEQSDLGFDLSLRFLHERRFVPFQGILKIAERLAGKSGTRAIEKLVELWIEKILVSRNQRASMIIDVHRFSTTIRSHGRHHQHPKKISKQPVAR